MSGPSHPVRPGVDPGPAGSGQRGPGGEARWGASATLAALSLVLLSAAALFGAGYSLGGQAIGDDPEERAALEAFMESYRRVSREFVGQVEPRQLIEGAIRGMFEELDDPYSSYLGPDEYAASLAGISGEFEGIGARMGSEDAEGEACEPIGEDCALVVIEVLPGAPAEEAGLLEGDVVLSVDGRALTGATIDDAVMRIRGPRDSEVSLGIERSGRSRTIAIVRDLVRSRDVRSEVLAEGSVGYLRVDGFSSGSDEDFRAALGDLLEAGIDRIVIDVRDDPGGFVDAAVAMASQFVASGPLLWQEDASGRRQAVEAIGGGIATDPSIEVVVLVNDGTASASEILAGALRDRGRATLVGETTFGKGTVQEWTQLPGDTGGFRLSVARWLTPAKTWIDGVGIEPDVIVAPGTRRFRPGDDAAALDADVQLSRALQLLTADEPFAAEG